MYLNPLTAAHLEQIQARWPLEYDALLGKLRWLLHTPYAQGLVVLHADRLLAVGGCMHFGATGWITLLRSVDDAAWAQLANALVAHLEHQGATGQSVLAPLVEVERWQALGFAPTMEVLRYSGGQYLRATRDEVIHYEPYHRMAMLRLAQRALGEDGSKLLTEYTYLGQVYAEGELVRGFSLLLLGLIIAEEPYAGLEMQRWHFPLRDHILLPAGNEAAHAHLTEHGYTTTVEGIRMVRGKVPKWKVEMVFGWG